MKSPNRRGVRKKAVSALTDAEKSLVSELVADGLSIQHRFRPEPRYKQTGQGHYDAQTIEEIKKAKARSKRRASR